MAHAWKEGDMVMLTVTRVDRDETMRVATQDGNHSLWLPAYLATPLPPTLTDEARAVLEAAVENITLLDAKFPGEEWNEDNKPLADAVYTYRATLTPPDPSQLALDALKAHDAYMLSRFPDGPDGPIGASPLPSEAANWRQVRAAIAAVEAAR